MKTIRIKPAPPQGQGARSQSHKPVIKAEEFTKKSKLLCLFCGGKSCSKENYLKNPNQNAIHGLHSDWITNDILAMQRPSTRLIKEHGVIESFKNAHIKAVFNLQLPGEHPYCGDGLQKDSGFTYRSEDFTDHGIFFFNFGWTDMEVTENLYMIKIMSHVDFIMNLGMKISVHCHAGTGRTGLVIASWLIYKNNLKALESRDLFRSKRHSGLSMKKQLVFLIKFQEFVEQSRVSFYQKMMHSVEQLVDKQDKIIFGKQKKQTQYLPFVMHQILDRLQFLLNNKKYNPLQVCSSFSDLSNNQVFESSWGPSQESLIGSLKEKINSFQWHFSQYGDCRILAQTLLDFFDQPFFQVIKNESAIKLEKKFEELESIERVFSDESIVELLGRYEYAMLSRLLVFIKVNFVNNNIGSKVINQFILRICISFLGKRQDLDSLFLERSFISTECLNNVVFSLYQFVSLWLQEMIDGQLDDNYYFDRLFGRVSCIIEGRKKQQSLNFKSPTKLINSNPIPRPGSILVGSSIKQPFSQKSRSDQNESNILQTNSNFLPPIKSPQMSNIERSVIPQPRLSEIKGSTRNQPKGNVGDDDGEEESKQN